MATTLPPGCLLWEAHLAPLAPDARLLQPQVGRLFWPHHVRKGTCTWLKTSPLAAATLGPGRTEGQRVQGPAAVLPRHPVPLGPQSRGRPLPAPRNRKSKCLFVGLAPKCSGRPAQGPLHGGRTCCFSVILSFGTSVSLAQCPEETAAKAKDGRAATSAGAEASAGVREQGGAPGGSKGARKCRGDRALGGGGSAGGGAGERGEGRLVPGPGGALRPVMPPGTSERAGWPPRPALAGKGAGAPGSPRLRQAGRLSLQDPQAAGE